MEGSDASNDAYCSSTLSSCSTIDVISGHFLACMLIQGTTASIHGESFARSRRPPSCGCKASIASFCHHHHHADETAHSY